MWAAMSPAPLLGCSSQQTACHASPGAVISAGGWQPTGSSSHALLAHPCPCPCVRSSGASGARTTSPSCGSLLHPPTAASATRQVSGVRAGGVVLCSVPLLLAGSLPTVRRPLTPLPSGCGNSRFEVPP